MIDPMASVNPPLQSGCRPSRLTANLPSFRISRIAKKALNGAIALLSTAAAISLVGLCLITNPLSIAVFAVTALALAVLLALKATSLAEKYLSEKKRDSFRMAQATVVDLMAKVALATIFPFSQTKYDPKKGEVDDSQTPILLVHGYLHNSSGWGYFRYRLNQAGFKNVFTVDLGSPFLSIVEYGEKLKEKAKEIEEITGRSDLNLIGHSMGGVVSSYYATELAPENSVKSLITLASPMRGTKAGKFGLGKCAKEMIYESDFMRSLHRKIKECPASCLHMGSKTDLIMHPYDTTLVEGHKFRLFDKLGHVSFLFSDRAIDSCIDFLSV